LPFRASWIGDVAHSGGRGRTVPMLLLAGARDHITRPDLPFRAAFALRPAATCDDYQMLSERVPVPSRAGSWLEGHEGTRYPPALNRLKQGVNADAASEMIFGASLGGSRADSFDPLHVELHLSRRALPYRFNALGLVLSSAMSLSVRSSSSSLAFNACNSRRPV
jgi:hypothetical protein